MIIVAAILAAGLAGERPRWQSAIEGAGVPYAIRYADCVYSADLDRRSGCSALKAELRKKAFAAYAQVYVRGRPQAERRFETFFDSMEKEAAWFRAKGTPLDVSVLLYLDCLSRGIDVEQASHPSPLGYFGRKAADGCRAQARGAVGRDRRLIARLGNLARYSAPGAEDAFNPLARTDDETLYAGLFPDWPDG